MIHGKHGQSLVEFAILLPVFLLIVVVIFDLGRAVYYYSVIFNAAREGALKALKQMVPGKIKVREVAIEDYEKLKSELEQKEKALADLTVDFMVLKKKTNGA